MDDGQKVITIAHPEHSSGELKMRCLFISLDMFNQLTVTRGSPLQAHDIYTSH